MPQGWSFVSGIYMNVTQDWEGISIVLKAIGCRVAGGAFLYLGESDTDFKGDIHSLYLEKSEAGMAEGNSCT